MASWGAHKDEGASENRCTHLGLQVQSAWSTSCTLLPFGQVVSEKRPGMCQGRAGGPEAQSCLLPPHPTSEVGTEARTCVKLRLVLGLD